MPHQRLCTLPQPAATPASPPATLQVEKAGGASSCDGKCVSALDVEIQQPDQRTQICYGSKDEVRWTVLWVVTRWSVRPNIEQAVANSGMLWLQERRRRHGVWVGGRKACARLCVLCCAVYLWASVLH